MAKRNSTKTATKEALQASEPRMMTFKGWQGINISESPLEWRPLEHGEQNDSALMPNFLVVQNNIDTTASKTLETRRDTVHIANAPAGKKFTGVSCLYQDKLICAFDDMSLGWIKLGTDEWHSIKVVDPDSGSPTHQWSCISYYQTQLICMTTGSAEGDHEMFTGDITSGASFVSEVSTVSYTPDPRLKATLKLMGELHEGNACRVSIGYVYTNKFGSTLGNDTWAVKMVDENPVAWHAGKYMEVSGDAKVEYGNGFYSRYGVIGVDIYCTIDDNNDAIFIGHADISPTTGKWSYAWLGSLMDTSTWTHVSLTLPTENTTKGVNASYVRNHDGRLYFWGGSQEYRLWMGGNPGSELSVARGVGGAWVDIEPGSGTEIKGTAKFKTYNGASIVTIMCSNSNSSKVKRYNLLETNITVSNELASKGYMTEEVANVVGSMSHYGFGSWHDGLYTVSRYGIMVTTMAMESQNQLKAISVSGAIDPIFSDRMANRLHNSRMIYINGIVYIVMGEEKGTDLDRVILCYDIDAKSWYTYTYEYDDHPLAIMGIDSEDHWEGIGIITPDKVSMIPVTGSHSPSKPTFDIAIETGELSTKQPVVGTSYIAQMEFRFDYFVGDLDITVEGIDYYGRYRTINKKVSLKDIQRSYTVYMRINELFETYKVIIKGKARFRLTHFISKLYQQSNKIGLVYGFNDHSYYNNRDGGVTDIHHRLDSYNNLRDAIIP